MQACYKQMYDCCMMNDETENLRVWYTNHDSTLPARFAEPPATLDESESRQMRAAETKKRRTREKLIHAADAVLRDDGLSATVEAIAEEAGVSTATFYSFYPSRNALCADVFYALVGRVLEQTNTHDRPFSERVTTLANLTEGRQSLTRAALMGRLDELHRDVPPDMWPVDFVRHLAWALWVHDDTQAFGIITSSFVVLHATALELLDNIAFGVPLETLDLSRLSSLEL